MGKEIRLNIEVTLHLNLQKILWRAFLKPGRKCKEINEIVFQNNLKAKVIEKYIEGDVLLEFNQNDEKCIKGIKCSGQMPLPPYIKRKKK